MPNKCFNNESHNVAGEYSIGVSEKNVGHRKMGRSSVSYLLNLSIVSFEGGLTLV